MFSEQHDENMEISSRAGDQEQTRLKIIIGLAIGVCLLLALLIISRYNYLLFHSLAEFFSIAVAFALFIVVWNSRQFVSNTAFVYIGTAYLFIGGLDLMHTISYKGMGVIAETWGANPATQLWIAARYMESISLFVFVAFSKKHFRIHKTLIVYSFITAFILFSIFYWRIFPDCFIEGVGLTSFKKISEYVICGILLAALTLMLRNRPDFDQKFFRLFFASIILTFFAELAFTFYVSVYGLSNLTGHYFKILSFFLIYAALIRSNLKEPYKNLFMDLDFERQRLEKSKSLLDATGRMARIGGWELDATTHEVTWTKETYRIHKAPFDYKPTLQEATTFFHPEDRGQLEEAIQRAIDNGEPYDMEIRFITATGKHLWTRTLCKPEVVDGKTVKLMGTFQDVTERKLAEEALRESEERYRSLFENNPIETITVDNEARVTGYNLVKKMSGGRQPNIGDVMYKDYAANHEIDMHEALMSCIRLGERKIFPEQKYREKYLFISMSPFPEGAIITSINITERKLAEDTLRKSESLHREAQRVARIGHWELDSPSGTPTWSKEIFHIFGLDPKKSEPSFSAHENIIHRDDWNLLESSIHELSEKGTPFDIEFRIRRALGDIGWMHAIGSAEEDENGKVVRMFGTAQDITERKRVEIALQEGEERYRQLFENMSSGVAVYEANEDSEDFLFKNINKAAEKIDKISKEEVIGKTVTSIFPGIHKFGLLDVFQRVWKSGVPENFPLAFYKDDRLEGWRENYVYKLPSGDIVAIYDDVTERKKEEQELKQSKLRLELATSATNIGHWDWDLISNKVYFSPLCKNQLGYKDNEIPNLFEEWESRLHPDDYDRTIKAVNDYIKGNSHEYVTEFRLRHKDGSYKLIYTRADMQFDNDGKPIRMFGCHIDITDRKRLEEELLRAKKLESVGLLASGIAHNFNNILTTILGNVSLAKEQVAPEDEIFDLLNEAAMASTRAQTLTKQLLTFAKEGAPVKKTDSIKDVLKESSSFSLRGSKSSCEFTISEDLWLAELDVGQMSQVISNIVINASQAMPEGGSIQVVAENLIIEDRHGLPVKPGKYIKISVTDKGVGIAENHLSDIFDPYFTTKQEGSGLGLATTYSIIKKHDGHITVESQLGVGTTFYIYLPASDKAVPEKEEFKLLKGQGRILVMDDEASLRKMAGRMLGKLGYESESAKDGAEAIRMVKEAKEAEKPYDAVILDLTIPGGMGGKEAINKLLELDPEVTAIVSSGYSDDPVLANFQEYGFKGVMPKPFESRSLSKVLHEVLKGEKE